MRTNYDNYKENWDKKFPDKTKFENWSNTLTKEQLKEVEEYFKNLKEVNENYMHKIKKECKKNHDKQSLEKSLNKIKRR